MRRYFMDDILAGIAYYLPDRSVSFRHDRGMWSEFFYAKRSKYAVLKDIHFRDRGLFPESQELDQAHSNLVGSGLLSSPCDYI